MSIRDSSVPVIDPEHDDLVPVARLVEARLGRRPSPATVWRWRLHGVRSGGETIRLECVRVAGVWHTTPAAWAEFVHAQTAAATAPCTEAEAPKARSEETASRLRTAGLLVDDASDLPMRPRRTRPK